MSISVEEIMAEYADRRRARGKLLEYMVEARDHVNGDVAVPLPQLSKNEKPAVANLISMGLDQTAMRVASTLPHLDYPALQPGKEKGAGSEEWAYKRQMANAHWWEQSRIRRKLRQLARWTIGYGVGSLVVEPDFDKGIPRFALRDPLATFPDIKDPWDDDPPRSVIYVYRKSFDWLKRHHPEIAAAYFRDSEPQGGSPIELLQYIDDEEFVLVLKSVQLPDDSWSSRDELTTMGIELVRLPNRAGVCLGVMSNRITFDRLQGAYNQLFGQYQTQATLMALELHAVKKGIFPDLVITSTVPGRTPQLVGGTWKDGMSGEVNVVKDGRMDAVQLNPGFMTQPSIDRLERNMRVQGNIPAQFGGETPTNIATGRLGDQILSATVDYPIQEYQEIIADTLQEANKRAIAVARGWFGDEKKSFYCTLPKNVGRGDYTPNTHFETDDHRVRYSAPGSDLNSMVIGNGQRVGLGAMSVETMVEQDPMIPDPQLELRRVASERLGNALLDSVSQMVVEGALDPIAVVDLQEKIQEGQPIGRALREVQEEMQQRQAEQAQQQQAQMLGGQPLPGAQPGLMGGQPGEAGMAIQPPNPNMQNLSQFLGALRQPRSISSPMAQAQPPNVPTG